MAELGKEVLHPKKALSFAVKFVLFMLIIGIIAIITLCYWRPISVCLGNIKICVCFQPKELETIRDPLQKEQLKSILKTGLSRAKSTSDMFVNNINSRRKNLRRSRSEVTFNQEEQRHRFEDSDDEDERPPPTYGRYRFFYKKARQDENVPDKGPRVSISKCRETE